MSSWLLLLGSNLADDGRVRQALDELSALGRCRALGPIRRLRPAGGGTGWYYNAVATLEHPDEAALREALRALQARLGREEGHPTRVDIDIDLVARADADGCWRMDRHTASKPEMREGPIREFFDAMGVVLHPPGKGEA